MDKGSLLCPNAWVRLLWAVQAVKQKGEITMGFLKNLFGKGKQNPGQLETPIKAKGKQYLFSTLGLPREGMSLEERVTKHQRDMAESVRSAGSVRILLNWQDIARSLSPNSPFLAVWQGRALAIARLDNMPRKEADQMRSAVEQNKVLLLPVIALCPTFSILGPRFAIFDSLTDPFVVEDPRNITLADIQDFISVVLNKGEGEFHLYWGTDAEPIASGGFSLCIDPRKASWSYKTSDADKKALWQSLNQAAAHLKNIPVTRRNFDAAVKQYFQET